MKNYVQKGHEIKVTAGAAIASGDLVESGAFVGVALADAASGEEVIVYVEGVYEVPKLGTDDVSQGDILYFDSGNARLTLSDGSGANQKAGYAVEAAGTGASLVKVKLER